MDVLLTENILGAESLQVYTWQIKADGTLTGVENFSEKLILGSTNQLLYLPKMVKLFTSLEIIFER
jgi:hypothetical protein